MQQRPLAALVAVTLVFQSFGSVALAAPWSSSHTQTPSLPYTYLDYDDPDPEEPEVLFDGQVVDAEFVGSFVTVGTLLTWSLCDEASRTRPSDPYAPDVPDCIFSYTELRPNRRVVTRLMVDEPCFNERRAWCHEGYVVSSRTRTEFHGQVADGAYASTTELFTTLVRRRYDGSLRFAARLAGEIYMEQSYSRFFMVATDPDGTETAWDNRIADSSDLACVASAALIGNGAGWAFSFGMGASGMAAVQSAAIGLGSLAAGFNGAMVGAVAAMALSPLAVGLVFGGTFLIVSAAIWVAACNDDDGGDDGPDIGNGDLGEVAGVLVPPTSGSGGDGSGCTFRSPDVLDLMDDDGYSCVRHTHSFCIGQLQGGMCSLSSCEEIVWVNYGACTDNSDPGDEPILAPEAIVQPW